MSSTSILASGIAALIIVLLAIWTLQGAAERRARKEAEAEDEALAESAAHNAFPVPPMPGETFSFTPRRSGQAAAITAATPDIKEVTRG